MLRVIYRNIIIPWKLREASIDELMSDIYFLENAMEKDVSEEMMDDLRMISLLTAKELLRRKYIFWA